MLGGSSSMNAMMWVRGFAADYDEWAEHAGEQWNYANIEKYFRRIEAGPLCHLASAQPAQLDRGLAVGRRGMRHRIEEPTWLSRKDFAKHGSRSARVPGGAPRTRT